MRRWRELRKAQLAGAEQAPPDPWAWMLAGDSKPGVDPKHQKFLEFQAIVERILTEDTDNDWESIRESCPDCRGVHASPWDHYVYHRNRFHQAGSSQAVRTGTAGQCDDSTEEETEKD